MQSWDHVGCLYGTPARLVVVQVRVEHDDAVRQDVGGVLVGEYAGVLAVVGLAKAWGGGEGGAKMSGRGGKWDGEGGGGTNARGRSIS